MIQRLRGALPLGVAVLLAACESGTDPEPPIARVVIQPDSVRLESIQDTVRLTASAFDAGGSQRTDVAVAWSALDAGAVTIDASGLANGLANGVGRVVATIEGLADTAAVSVRQVAVQLTVTPGTDTLDALQETRALEASGQDANGFALAPGAAITWESLDSAVVSVDSAGVLLSRARGTARVRAASGAVAETVTVVVRQIVTSVEIAPAEEVAFLNDTLRLTAMARDANEVLVPDAVVEWASSNTVVATVDAAGLVQGVRLGEVDVTATSGDASAMAGIRVRAFPIAAYGSYGCFLDGLQRAQCWGGNTQGQLGDGTTTDSDVPVPVSGGHAFVDIAVGLHHACALTADGTAHCWGANSYGQLGTTATETCAFGSGTIPCSTEPLAVDGGLIFVALAAGSLHNCGLTETGQAYCWGDGGAGQLGRGNYVPASEPVAVSGDITFASIAPGSGHTCGVTTDGTAYCWGANGYGELGDGTTTAHLTPAPVSDGHTFASVSAAYRYTCGATVDGTAYCWGENDVGQLGDGTTEDRHVPTRVAGTHDFRVVDTSNATTCGLTAEDTVYCWGYPSNRMLHGTHPGGYQPSPVTGEQTYVAISIGGHGACGVTPRGSVFCGVEEGEDPLYTP